jgi:hypothetical protein
MPHKIAFVDVETKKGHTQTLRFLIKQETPHPDITGIGNHIRWRNGSGLFSEYGKPATGISQTYHCYLLPDDNSTPPIQFDRRHLAGYPNPNGEGPLCFRGKNLGEITVTITQNHQTARVCGFETPTKGEHTLFEQWIYPQLRDYIHSNRQELYADALENIQNHFDKILAALEDCLVSLREESQKAITLLKNKK